MMTVKEVSALTGVSIRTLQYYDKIGLLKATAYSPAGYRLYDETALERMQEILLFRELEFPLKDIRRILNSPDYDKARALQQQITLLELKKEHIEGLIALARTLHTTGGAAMHFQAFDKSKQEAWAKQAKESWGSTPAYQEFEQKNKGRTHQDNRELGQALMAILAQFGPWQHRPAGDPQVQAQVKKLQEYITEHYYTCTSVILAQLGQMYAAGGAFTANIDAAGGEGTARFAAEAIQVYCSQNR